MTSDDSPVADSAPNGPERSPGGGAAQATLLGDWARSAAVAYFVILGAAALAIGLDWPDLEWAFDARRLFGRG